MRAGYYSETGPAHEVLKVGELEDPTPGDGEVLVAVRASGINPADVKRRAGWLGTRMEHPLVIPHTDGAGVIEAVGESVDPKRIGQRVWIWNAQGDYGEARRAFGTAAERIALPEAQAVPLSEGLSFAQGACIGIPAMTAYLAVFADGDISGQNVLVPGAGGAVGNLAAQFALHGGAKVIATTGNRGRAGLARAAGVKTLLERNDPDLARKILDITDGRGVDRIIEVDFGANLPVIAKVLANGGVVASYSSTADPTPTLPYYAFAARGGTVRFVQGFRVPAELRPAGEAHIAKLIDEGNLIVPIGLTFPLSQIAEAHEAVETGAGIGQTVVKLT